MNGLGHSDSNKFVSVENPGLNFDRNEMRKNYGSMRDSNNQSSDEFGYVEFGGKDGRTCPTCEGTGRIAKHQEDELVALIPYNDQRLKPSRTKCYVCVAVLFCLIASALVLFFLFPRTVSIKEDEIWKVNVTVGTNDSSIEITLWNRFNVSNSNFFPVTITSLQVLLSFDLVQVGEAKWKKVPVHVGARTSNYTIDVKIDAMFSGKEQRSLVEDLCINPKRTVHNILFVLQATQTVSYLQHREQSSLTAYKYVDCSLKKPFWKDGGATQSSL